MRITTLCLVLLLWQPFVLFANAASKPPPAPMGHGRWSVVGSAIALSSGAFRDPYPECSDADSGYWTSRPNGVLLHMAVDGKLIASYLLPKTPVTAYPISPAIAAVGNTLYVLSCGKLWSRQEGSAVWTAHDLPVKSGARFDRDTLLIAIDGMVWIDVDHRLIRYEPSSGTMRQWPFSASGIGPLGEVTLEDVLRPDHYIGVANGQMWFYTDSNSIELASISADGTHSQLLETYVPNHGYSWLPTYAISGRTLLWLDRVPEDGRATGKVLRWDFGTRQTSTVGYIRDIGNWQALFASDDAIYVAVTVRSSGGFCGDVYRYSIATGDWGLFAPPATSGSVIPGFVDEKGALFEDAKNAKCFWKWDAALKSWVSAQAPVRSTTGDGSSAQGSLGRYAFDQSNSVRIGDSIYFTNNHQELWRYDTAKNQVSRVAISVPQVDDTTVQARCASAASVWISGEGPLNSPIVGRLDIRSGEWKLWDATSGLPAYAPFYPKDEFAEDGTSILATSTLNRVLRLDPSTDEWENLTPAIDQAFQHCSPYAPEKWTLASDPPFVWLCAPNDRTNQDGTFGLGPPVLVRWDGGSGKLSPSAPTSSEGRTLDWAVPVAVSPSSVWIMAAEGIWEFNKSSSTWRFHETPTSVPTPKQAGATAIQCYKDGTVWLLGHDSVLRYFP